MRKLVLGLDIGSVAVSAVLIANRNPGWWYIPHHGDVPAALEKIQAELDARHISSEQLDGSIAVTGRAGTRINGGRFFDSQLCCIRSVQQNYPDVRSIILVGGEAFRLFRFNVDGSYRDSRSSTSCAAGTGSFLDQQAGRLGMADSAELATVAAANTDSVPKVATRCAVFAKTDLIHAQQEGYSLPAISEGLCRGLAKNLYDTLISGKAVAAPIVCTGGVAMNTAVTAHLEHLMKKPVTIDRQALFQGAQGAALLLLEEQLSSESAYQTSRAADDARILKLSERWMQGVSRSGNWYPSLGIRYSDYPDFSCLEAYDYPADNTAQRPAVEVELFRKLAPQMDVYIGMDIGSTSTKAVLTDMAGEVYAGVYTRTAGRPIAAFQALFAALNDLARRNNATLSVVGSAATGSGRKFIGSIINADEILDEISAHARAAVELNPAVDTIIEIGGQDAKFTTLHKGLVTLSIMNTVCAAGTGSFLEEQALRLGVSIRDYADRALGSQAPHVSDRCTVFMERDVNHLLAEGIHVSEALTAAIHAVRENYLRKVAQGKQIGKTVMFQGATARNKALVAAFEQELQRPIYVSRYCHLTGALGAALVLRDNAVVSEKFRGLILHESELPVRSEVCELCTNHCKLTLTDVKTESGAETLAFGFLCGRDYATGKFVSSNKSGFDLLRERKKIELQADKQSRSSVRISETISEAPYTVGIPFALNMVEDISFWKYFFREIRVPYITGEKEQGALSLGKEISEAEFCAPMSAYYGQVHALRAKSDYVFVPLYLQNSSGQNSTGIRGARQQYCYFTQHATAAVNGGERLIHVLGDTVYDTARIRQELQRAFELRDGHYIPAAVIGQAYDNARKRMLIRNELLSGVFGARRQAPDEVDALLLGRPYLALDSCMNKSIPEVFGNLGIRVFYQDMIPPDSQAREEIQDLLEYIPWYYARQILSAAAASTRIPGLYPVFVTAFKCGPDSFTVDFFRRIMEAAGKPYLILELDEHDSSVGYETRIEAAVRTFRNHARTVRSLKETVHSTAESKPEPVPQAETNPELSFKRLPHIAKTWVQGMGILPPRSAKRKSPQQIHWSLQPDFLSTLRSRTVIMPNWDNLTVPLLASVLRGQGLTVVVMEESEALIRRSLHTNTGQCLPMNVIAENFIETVDSRGLDPSFCALWLPRADYACNIPMFPLFIRNVIRERGRGFEESQIYVGELTFTDISPLAPIHAYFAYLCAGILRRIGCRIRPYELEPGQTDAVTQESLHLLQQVFEDPGTDRMQTVKEVIRRFEEIPYDREASRPKVALFGDIYVRDNEVFNQDIIRTIEAHGGEVITTPYSEFAMMIAESYFTRWFKEGKYLKLIAFKFLKAAMTYMERAYHSEFERVLSDSSHDYGDDAAEILSHFDLRLDHSGETADNILKTWYLKKHYPDIVLFAQLNPGFCCAGLVTEALTSRIEEVIGVPVVSLSYDGIGGNKNDSLIPYITTAAKARQFQLQ